MRLSTPAQFVEIIVSNYKTLLRIGTKLLRKPRDLADWLGKNLNLFNRLIMGY